MFRKHLSTPQLSRDDVAKQTTAVYKHWLPGNKRMAAQWFPSCGRIMQFKSLADGCHRTYELHLQPEEEGLTPSSWFYLQRWRLTTGNDGLLQALACTCMDWKRQRPGEDPTCWSAAEPVLGGALVLTEDTIDQDRQRQALSSSLCPRKPQICWSGTSFQAVPHLSWRLRYLRLAEIPAGPDSLAGQVNGDVKTAIISSSQLIT